MGVEESTLAEIAEQNKQRVRELRRDVERHFASPQFS